MFALGCLSIKICFLTSEILRILGLPVFNGVYSSNKLFSSRFLNKLFANVGK